jgi:hypothetical protein
MAGTACPAALPRCSARRDLGREPAASCTHAGHYDVLESEIVRYANCCPCGQHDIRGIGDDLWHAHRRRDDQEANRLVIGRDHDGGPDYKLLEFLQPNDHLDAGLQLHPEELEVSPIDSAIHEAERIRGAHDRVDGSIENGSVRDLNDVWQFRKVAMSLRDQQRIETQIEMRRSVILKSRRKLGARVVTKSLPFRLR